MPESLSIPFAFFESLLHAISGIKPHRAGHTKQSSSSTPRILKTLDNWIIELRRRYHPIPPDTIPIFFKLFFPEDDVDRKYGIQEMTLASYLATILHVSTSPGGRGFELRRWNAESSIGCLGAEVKNTLQEASTITESIPSLAAVNTLLSELASTSPFSSSHIRKTHPDPRSKLAILTQLYSDLSPLSAAFLTQIILKDLRPLLYPLCESQTHYTTFLLNYNANSIRMLTKEEAMKAWDPSGAMLKAYRVRADLDAAVEAVYASSQEVVTPRVGIPVTIPKCLKAQSCKHSLHLLRQAREKLWVETKYDGERAQIHVEIDDRQSPCSSRITIFSKSKRDSTLDRAGVHSIIRDALGLPSPNPEELSFTPSLEARFTKNIILEAEMVAFSSPLNRIDEFWRIRSLIASTAIGVRHRDTTAAGIEDSQLSQASMISTASDGTRHLALVFFDILLLDNVSLLQTPYSQRRSTLESVLYLRDGFAMLAARVPVSLTRPSLLAKAGPSDLLEAEEEMRNVFARRIAEHEEGVVVKADESWYGGWKLPWVKLKKDYIPGYGDTVDLVLLAASWDKDRARELLVAPTVFTTFYVGVLANTDKLREDPTIRPHFEVLFTVSYGLTREKLEELNFMIKSSDTLDFKHHNNGPSLSSINGLEYTYNLYHGLPAPRVLLSKPLLAEIFGAGFTKDPGSKYYSLRFPRLTKVFSPSSRPYLQSLTLTSYQTIARESIGKDKPNKDIDDWCKTVWGKAGECSPSVRSEKRKRERETVWREKLEKSDGVLQGGNGEKRRKGKQKEKMGGVDKNREESEEVLSRHSPRNLTPLAGMKTIDFSVLSPMTPTKISKGKEPLKAFTSVTNMKTSSSPSHNNSPSFEDNSGQNLLEEQGQGENVVLPLLSPFSPTSPRRATTMKQSSYSPPSSPKNPFPSKHNWGPPTCKQPPTTTSATTNRLNPALPYTYHNDTALSSFLKDAIIFLAKPSNAARPEWRRPSKELLPVGQQVHGLEAFLKACHWELPLDHGPNTPALTFDVDPCDWVKKGVIFVDDTDGLSPTRREQVVHRDDHRLPGSEESPWLEYPITYLIHRKSTLIKVRQEKTERQSTNEMRELKPVWVFSISMLCTDRVGQSVGSEGGLKQHAICRL